MRIEILGPGCSRCFATERHVKHALDVLQLRADVVHLHDPKEYAKYGVLFTPAVVVDGAVKCAGRIPSTQEVEQWLCSQGQSEGEQATRK